MDRIPTGQTTKILIRLAQYITDNWDSKKKIIFVAYSNRYATELLNRLLPLFPSAEKPIPLVYKFGEIIIKVESFAGIRSLRGYDPKTIMLDDHYLPYDELSDNTISEVNYVKDRLKEISDG